MHSRTGESGKMRKPHSRDKRRYTLHDDYMTWLSARPLPPVIPQTEFSRLLLRNDSLSRGYVQRLLLAKIITRRDFNRCQIKNPIDKGRRDSIGQEFRDISIRATAQGDECACCAGCKLCELIVGYSDGELRMCSWLLGILSGLSIVICFW